MRTGDFSVTWENTAKQTRLMVSAWLAFINFRLSGSQHCFALQRLPISRCHNPLLLICEQNQTKPSQTWGEVSGKFRSPFLALVSAIFTHQQDRHVQRNLDFSNPNFSNLQVFPPSTEKRTRSIPKNWDSGFIDSRTYVLMYPLNFSWHVSFVSLRPS